MSSIEQAADKGLFSTFLAIHHGIDNDGSEEASEEKPVEPDNSAKWQPGGYTPSRASWHTFRGKVKSYLS